MMEVINKNRIEHDNNDKPYTEVGSEIGFCDNGAWKRSSHEVEDAEHFDIADFKTYKSPRKYGLAKEGWTIGSKPNGFQLRFKPVKLALWNNGEHVDCAYSDTRTLNIDGLITDCFGSDIDIKLTNKQGGQNQTIIIKNKPTIINPFGAKAEFSYWTEIENSDALHYYCQNMKYEHGEFLAGYWNKKDDCEVDTIWLQQDTELEKDLLHFENVILRPEVTEWRDTQFIGFKDYVAGKGKIGKRIIGFDDKEYVIYATSEEFNLWVDIRTMIKDDFFGEKTYIIVPIAVVVQEAIYEKKRLVNRSGKIYLVESIPLWYLDEWDYTDPLLLSYTTVSGALGSNTTYTAGTYYISSQVTMGAYNLTVDPNVIIKINTGANNGIGVTGAGDLDINGTSALPVYMTSKNDDSVGEAIAGSTAIPEPGDYVVTAYISSTTGTGAFDYMIARYGGGNVLNACFALNINNAGKFTFNNCVFEQLKNVAVSRGTGMTGTQCELHICKIRTSSETSGFAWVEATNVYITHLEFQGAMNYSSATIRVLAPTDSYIRNVFMPIGYAGYGIYVDAIANPNVLNIVNVTIPGGDQTTNRYGIAIIAGDGVVNVKHCVVGNLKVGLFEGAVPTMTSDRNTIFANDTNYSGLSPGANDSQEDAMFELNFDQENIFPFLQTTSSPGYGEVTSGKIGDADYPLAGRTCLADNTLLVTSGNVPRGYCPKGIAGGAAAPAIDIDVSLKLAGTRTVQFAQNDTIQVTGNLNSTQDTTAADVVVSVKYVSGDTLAETLFSGTTDLTASTPKDLSSIAGSALTFTTVTMGEYYIYVSVSGGTPALNATQDSQVTFVVDVYNFISPSTTFDQGQMLLHIQDAIVSGVSGVGAGSCVITVKTTPIPGEPYPQVLIKDGGYKRNWPGGGIVDYHIATQITIIDEKMLDTDKSEQTMTNATSNIFDVCNSVFNSLEGNYLGPTFQLKRYLQEDGQSASQPIPGEKIQLMKVTKTYVSIWAERH